MKKKGIAYIKMVLSFALVLCLSLSVVVLFFFYSSDVMTEQVDYANKNLLVTVQSVCDQEFRFYENTLKIFASDEFVEDLGEMEDLDSSRYEDIEELEGQMMASVFSMDNFDGAGEEILIYFPKIDQLFSTKYGGMILTSVYQQLAFSNRAEPMEALLEQMQEKSLFSTSILWNGYAKKDMLLLTRTCWSRNEKCEATVGVWLDMEKVSDRISTIDWQNGFDWIILDENDRVLKGVEGIAESGTQIDFSQLEGNDEYFVSSISSEEYNWRYVLLVPKAIVSESVTQIRVFFFISMGVCLLLGIFLIRKISLANYAPLQNLIQPFENKQDSVGYLKNEYEFLQEQISSLITTSTDMKRKITDSHDNLKKLALVNLLVRPFTNLTLPDEQDHLSELSQGQNMVMVIKEKSWSAEHKTSDYTDEQKMFIIDNVFNEKVGEQFLCRMVEVDGCQVLIVHDDDLFAREELLWEIAENLQQTVLNHFDLHITLAAGGIHGDLAGVHDSYLEALEADEFISILDQDSIDYDDVRDNMLRKYDYPMQAQERIIAAIRNNNEELAMSFINRTLERNLVENRISSNMRRCLIHEIYCTLLKAADEKDCIEKITISQNSLSVENSLDELLQKYTKIVKTICTEEEMRSESSADKELCQRVRDYVYENYESYDLNISQTAQHFRMSPSNLSSVYKRETGKSLLKEINDIRIEKAIEFLQTGYSVVETAEKVGISESSSFIRLFKKHVGITPGQMKAHLQKNKEIHSK